MNQQIINTLKKYPYKSIAAIARQLNIKEIEVSQAQHEYLKVFIKRDSKMWNASKYGKN